MRLEQTPRPEQTLRVSARLITSSTILHLSSDELERAVNQEQIENPALEVAEQKICLFCGTHIYGQNCTACGHAAEPTQPLTQASHFEAGGEHLWADHYQGSNTYYDIDNYGFAEIDNDDAYDLLAHIPTGETLVETLL